MMFLTDNLITVEVANVQTEEKIGRIELRTQAGQVSDNGLFRIGNDTATDETDVLVFTSDPNVSVSTDSVRGFGPALSIDVAAGKVGSTIFVKVTADLDAEEGERQSTIIAGEIVLSLDYFVTAADQGDTEFSPMQRLSGSDTLSILEQVDAQGEALVLARYDPLPKPGPIPLATRLPLQDFRNRNIAEWTNPNNAQVGYSLTTYNTKGFVGDRDLLQDLQYSSPVGLTYGDAEQIILPADFSGFNPTAFHVIEFFSQLTPTQRAYQQTQWTVLRHDGEYALINIRKQKYYRGQLLFFAADLQRVNYPGASSGQGFLPWNQLYDESGKVIDYVTSFSRETIADPYDPYCDLLQKIVIQRAYLIATDSAGVIKRIPADQDMTVVAGVKHDDQPEIFAYRQLSDSSNPDTIAIAAISFSLCVGVTTTPPAATIAALQLELEVTFALGSPNIEVLPLGGLNLTLATGNAIMEESEQGTPYATVPLSTGIQTIALDDVSVDDLKSLMATGENRFSLALRLAAEGVRIVGAIEGEAPNV